MQTDEVDVRNIHPQDYLKDGFFDAEGNLREGINGTCSLGIAYQCLDESIQPDVLKNIVDQVTKLGDERFKRGEVAPTDPLDAPTISGIDRIANGRDVSSSKALSAVFAAAKPFLKNWKGFGALLVHLERIMEQLALISKTRFEPLLPHQQ